MENNKVQPLPVEEVEKMPPAARLRAIRAVFKVEVDTWSSTHNNPELQLMWKHMMEALFNSLTTGKLDPRLIVKPLGWAAKQQDDLEARGLIR